MGDFEKAIASGLAGNREKTFIDKLMSKEDALRLRELIKRDNYNRADLKEIMDIISGNELKVLSLSEWERYIMAKFFVWITEIVKLFYMILDYKDKVEADSKICKQCGAGEDKHTGKDHIFVPKFRQTKESIIYLSNICRLHDHSIKSLILLYVNLNRSGLSIGGRFIKEVLSNKYEFAYPNSPAGMNAGGQTAGAKS